jgi:purine-binding chemotaxis protein CheW
MFNAYGEGGAGNSLELISFMVEGQEFGLDIKDILEIRGFTQPTPIAHAPAYVKGVISLRGVVMPVIDLSARLMGAGIAGSERNVIIVVQAPFGPMGLLVEAVCDNMVVDKSAVQNSDAASGGSAPEFVRGFLPLEKRMVTLLGLDSLAPGDAIQAAMAAA